MKITIKDFVPRHTFDCGQCFRWEENPDGSYTGVAGGQVVKIRADCDEVTIDGINEKDYEIFWRNYLDADRDYTSIKKVVSTNSFMKDAVAFGHGIRILKQDFFEVLISFIVSQRSSIPKIKSSVEKMCSLWGNEIKFEGKTFYTFPTPEKLASLTESDIRSVGVGYRAPYILQAAQAVCNGDICADELHRLDTPSARNKLLSLYGVGDKVCDCVLLFSIGKYDLFPADVWIKRVMEENFNSKNAKNEGEKLFGEYSGFAQQYLFYWRKFSKEN